MRYKLAMRWLSFLLLITLGCSNQARNSAQRVQVEHDSVTEIALQEVMATPTEFFIPVEEDRFAWGRARMFFEQKEGAKPSIISTPSHTEVSNSNTKGDKYLYRVIRQPAAGGFQYTVTCRPRLATGANLCKRNAKNVARFVKDGSLERTLLDG